MLYLFKPVSVCTTSGSSPPKYHSSYLNVEVELEKAHLMERAERENKTEEKKQNKWHGSEIKNTETSFDIYKRLADKEKNSEAQFRVALKLLDRGELEEAFNYMQLAANNDSPIHSMAKCLLGEMYVNGIGVNKDESEAIRWFKQADASQEQHSCPRALMHLAVIHRYGIGTAPNTREASLYLRKAENSYEHFYCTEFGNDVGDDTFYLKPAEVLPSALFLLAEKHSRETDVRDLYLRRAAEAGHPLAAYLLQNQSLLATYLNPRSEHTDIAYNIGAIYANEKHKNYTSEAIYHLKHAADRGHIQASLVLGDLYIEKGDYETAKTYLQKAYVNQSSKREAAASLAKLYEKYADACEKGWNYLKGRHCLVEAENYRAIANSERIELKNPVSCITF